MVGLQQPLAIMGVVTGTGLRRLWRKIMRRTVCRLLGHRWKAHPTGCWFCRRCGTYEYLFDAHYWVCRQGWDPEAR